MSPAAERFDRLRDLVDMEDAYARGEHRRALQGASPDKLEASGWLLRKLEVKDERPLGRRMVVTLGRTDDGPLSRAGFRSGTRVRVDAPPGAERADRGLFGVVRRRRGDTIDVALDGFPPAWLYDGRHALAAIPDEVTSNRMRWALRAARDAKGGSRLARLREVLGYQREPTTVEHRPVDEGILDGLNPGQRAAVRAADRAGEVHLVHGPPGTGKTATVVAIVQQALARGERVLCAAPSNAAACVLAERLVQRGAEGLVRVGHPARVRASLQAVTLRARADASEDAAAAKRLFRKAREAWKRLGSSRRPRTREERRAERADARALQREAREASKQAVRRVLQRASVVVATLAGAGSLTLKDERFDLCVIDEAAQAVEPAAWIAITRCKEPEGRIVLAGDHCQLPPTVLCAEAAKRGLAVTLFERLVAALPSETRSLLTTQYRMHEAIARFSSERFYGGKLDAALGNATHVLSGLPGVSELDPWGLSPIWVLDTAGAGFAEEPAGTSLENPGEAWAVAELAARVLASGLAPADLGVITPYRGQVAQIRERLEARGIEGVEVATADGFQGREKEAILISCVRGNERGAVGFLADPRRMNVAMTRARRFLVVVLDSATVATDPLFAALLDHAEAEGVLTSVWEHDLVAPA